ncbi:hypothetical protein NHX12_029501 [Muraenolepis orangiensis]|uniref:Ig-like domain-containing protein n=1 Tax=Muraenolepis orangiensis TaxID=630683 RepID=A0A9Q0I4F7_9TELE|nr:hypothetical protein NHX12_029501 [Muraenolepis orangiensis]
MELACHVTNITHLPPGGLLGVTWEHTPPPGAVLQAAHAIGSLDYRGNLLPGPGYSDRLDSGVMSLTRVQPNTFKLHLLKTQEVDMGQYGCSVSAWVQDRQGAAGKLSESLSPPLTVTWTPKRPSLSVAAQRVREASVGGATFEMSCTVASQNLEEAAYSVLVQSQESVDSSNPVIGYVVPRLEPDDVAYEVSWFFARLRGDSTPSLLAEVSRYGVVRKELRNSSSDVSLERRDDNTYQLSVHGTQDSDSGEYHCSATPWYLSASTGSWTQAQELNSAKVFLTVRFAVWESLKQPLLYGAAASLGVGLFSLVLGLVCAHCCCRNTMHTPRSRNKLMDLEMD